MLSDFLQKSIYRMWQEKHIDCTLLVHKDVTDMDTNSNNDLSNLYFLHLRREPREQILNVGLWINQSCFNSLNNLKGLCLHYFRISWNETLFPYAHSLTLYLSILIFLRVNKLINITYNSSVSFWQKIFKYKFFNISAHKFVRFSYIDEYLKQQFSRISFKLERSL